MTLELKIIKTFAENKYQVPLSTQTCKYNNTGFIGRHLSGHKYGTCHTVRRVVGVRLIGGPQVPVAVFARWALGEC